MRIRQRHTPYLLIVGLFIVFSLDTACRDESPEGTIDAALLDSHLSETSSSDAHAQDLPPSERLGPDASRPDAPYPDGAPRLDSVSVLPDLNTSSDSASSDSASKLIVEVKSFGAHPNDTIDDGPAIRAAIAKAIQAPHGAEVVFQAGRYRLSSLGKSKSHLFIKGASKLTLRGVKGATVLVFTDPCAHGLFIDKSQAITLTGLRFDYDPLPFTQGKVVAVNTQGGSFDLALDKGYPTFNHPMFDASAPSTDWGIVVKARQSYELAPIFPQGLPSTWKKIKNRTYRVVAQGGAASLAASHITVGAHYVSLARGCGISAAVLRFWRIKGLTVSGVTVHASPGAAMLLALSEDILIKDYHVAFPPTGDRLLTTDADGVHALGNRGRLEIRHASFMGMADDAINIHGRAAIIRKSTSKRSLDIATGGTVFPRPGDTIAVYDPEGGHYRGRATIASVTSPGGNTRRLTLDRDIKGIVANASDPKKADWLFNLDACGRGAWIHHNTFGAHRGRSIVLRAPEAIVEDNTFKNADGLAINILVNGAWGEGPIPHHIKIRKNTFIGIDRAINNRARPAISTAIVRRSGGYAPSMTIEDIGVQNNVFEGLKGTTMLVSNATRFRVLGNWTNNTRQNKIVKSPSILFRAGVSASLDAYALTDKNPQTYAGIHIHKGAKVTYTKLKMDLAPNIPWVRNDNP